MMDPQIKAGIFAGESGGDYSALYGYQNRNGGRWAGFDPTRMTINQVLEFQDPQGPYGQWVKGQIGRVSTPVGAYQIVGSTLRDFKDRMGLTGNEMFDQAMQDRIANEILKAQGTGAWEGYQGPRQPGQASQGGPQGGPQMDQQQFAPNWKDRLIMNLEGLMHRPNRAVIANAQANIDRDRAQFEQNRTAGWFESMGDTATANAIRSGVVSGGDAFKAYYAAQQGPSTPESFQALQLRAREAGLVAGTPEYQAFMQSGGRSDAPLVQIGDGSEIGTIPPGFEVVRDENGNRFMRPIPGGPAAAEVDAAATRANAASRQSGVQETVIGDAVDQLVTLIDSGGVFDLPEAGIYGNVLAHLGVNQQAVDFKNTLATIQAGVAFDRLQAMREASKTGGALGAVSERELTLLMNAYGNIEQSTSPATLKANLLQIKRIMSKIENDPVASTAYYESVEGARELQGMMGNGDAAPSGGGFSVTGSTGG